jgi:hypothetical protein
LLVTFLPWGSIFQKIKTKLIFDSIFQKIKTKLIFDFCFQTHDLANSGIKVYLLERSPAIGGKMAQLDKTFPTLDCSSCILTPKMMEVANHENIELFMSCYALDFKDREEKEPNL